MKFPFCILILALPAMIWSAGCTPSADVEGGSVEESSGTSVGDVVARVNGYAIRRSELQRASGWATHITRSDAAERQLQRVAMRDMLLPRAAVASQAQESRATALERAQAVKETLVDGMPGPKPPASGETEAVRSGDIRTFGPFILGAALELEPGEWSDPIEGLGLFHLVRLVELPAEGSAPSITLGVIDFPYHSLSQSPDELLTESTLEIVDPALHEIIPAALRHRMNPKNGATQASQ